MYSLIVVFEKIHWSTSLGGAYERMNALSRGEGVNLCRIFAKCIGLYCTALRIVVHWKEREERGVMCLIINCNPLHCIVQNCRVSKEKEEEEA